MNKKSGHWTNTGMAKFINDNLYNYKSGDAKSMNPFRWYRLQNGEDVSKYRETINGFPCRLILINDGSTPLNEGQNEPTPGNTKDMGIFNFNNDKDNVTTLGFNSDIFPNCASYEVTANSDTSAGAFISYSNSSKNLWSGTFDDAFLSSNIYSVDNSISYSTIIEVEPGKTYKVSKEGGNRFRICFFAEYPVAGSKGTDTNRLQQDDLTEATVTCPNNYPYMVVGVQHGASVVEGLKLTVKEVLNDSNLELAYLKESFELRHPDEDDVAEDWGFMGVEAEKPVHVIDYSLMNPDIKFTTVIEKPESMSIETASNCTFFFAYYKDGEWTNNSGNFGGTSSVSLTDRSETHVAIGLRGGQSEEYIIINGVKYLFGNEVAQNTFKDPYFSETVFETVFDNSYGLKALIDWVDNCTDEEFVRDFEQHFHKDYTLRYFCLVTLLGAVDNLG